MNEQALPYLLVRDGKHAILGALWHDVLDTTNPKAEFSSLFLDEQATHGALIKGAHEDAWSACLLKLPAKFKLKGAGPLAGAAATLDQDAVFICKLDEAELSPIADAVENPFEEPLYWVYGSDQGAVINKGDWVAPRDEAIQVARQFLSLKADLRLAGDPDELAELGLIQAGETGGIIRRTLDDYLTEKPIRLTGGGESNLNPRTLVLALLAVGVLGSAAYMMTGKDEPSQIEPPGPSSEELRQQTITTYFRQVEANVGDVPASADWVNPALDLYAETATYAAGWKRAGLECNPAHCDVLWSSDRPSAIGTLGTSVGIAPSRLKASLDGRTAQYRLALPETPRLALKSADKIAALPRMADLSVQMVDTGVWLNQVYGDVVWSAHDPAMLPEAGITAPELKALRVGNFTVNGVGKSALRAVIVHYSRLGLKPTQLSINADGPLSFTFKLDMKYVAL